MAIVVAPGQLVPQSDWDTLTHQHGESKGEPTKVAPTEEQIKAAALAGDSDPSFKQHPIYRYYFSDGTYVDARTAADGANYQVVDYKPSSQFTQDPANRPGATSAGSSGDNPRVPAGSVPNIEGTPIPGQPGKFDNNQPIRAWHTPDGKIVYEPLTPAERLQWERDKNGGKTDQEVRDDAKPGQSAVTYTEINGQKYATQTTPGKNGGAPTIQHFDPAGHPIAQLPAQVKPGEIVKGGGEHGEDVQAVAGSDGRLTYEPIKGAQAPGLIKGAEGMPDLDTSTAESAHASYMRQYQWGQAQIRTSKMSPDQVVALLKPSESVVKSILDKTTADRNAEQQRLTQALTERSQDMTQSGNRLTNATSQFNTALDAANKTNLLAGPGQNAAAVTLFGTLAAQNMHSAAIGGLRESAPVVPGPMANLPRYQAPVTPAAASVGSAPMAEKEAASQAAAAAAGGNAMPITNATTATIGAKLGSSTPAASAAAQAAPASRPDQTQVGSQIDNAIMPPQQTAQPTVAGIYHITNPTTGGTIVFTPDGKVHEISATGAAEIGTWNPASGQPPGSTPGEGQTPAASSIPPASPIPSGAPPGSAPAGTPQWVGPGDPIQVPGEASGVTVPYPSNAGAESRTYGVPVMALAGSMSGQHPYQPAIDSLKAMGLSDAAIQEALKMHMSGAAA